jgi:hypothetical protein
LLAPIEEAQRKEMRIGDQLTRETDPAKHKELKALHDEAMADLSASVRGHRCAVWLRNLVRPILPKWDWDAPPDGRGALLEQHDRYNMLGFPAAYDGTSQLLRAKDLAVIALLIGAWPTVAKSADDTPRGVINKEAARFANVIAKQNPNVKRGPV